MALEELATEALQCVSNIGYSHIWGSMAKPGRYRHICHGGAYDSYWNYLFNAICFTSIGHSVLTIRLFILHIYVDVWKFNKWETSKTKNYNWFTPTVITCFKGTISDHPFQTSLFSKAKSFFCIFKENFTVITYLYNNSFGNSIFLERETNICCLELIIADNLGFLKF